MKLIIILLTAGVLQVSATTYGQSVTLKTKKATLVSIFKEIRKQTGYDFIYSDRMMEKAGLVDLDFNNVSVEEALKRAFMNQPFIYEMEKKIIVVKAMHTANQQQRIITGKVTDDNDDVLVGVSIKSQKTNTVTKTDKNGKYAIKVGDNTDVLTFSYIGYEPRTMKVSDKEIINVQLRSSVGKLNDVVITGTGIDRKKDSFTGASATFSGAELKQVGNNNIIASLKALDPAFIQIDNDRMGSNPNALPVIELRGKTTVEALSVKDQFGTDPNQPLFVLDGFETTLQTIIDLDMNRVASVIILKDAASTALYGSKAANGVVVIETIKPKPGKVTFSYTNDLRIEGPDLSVYNMMNAAEKLEFERLSGRYKIDDVLAQIVLDSTYYSHLGYVARGIDSYWLAEPVRNIISQNNSIMASGGDESLRYGVGFNYKSNPGVMKGSGRNSWGTNVNLHYRKSKVNITNSLSIGGDYNTESPYGSYISFVNTNPYYEKDPTRSFLDKPKGHQTSITLTERTVSNPLYNASLPFKSEGQAMTLTNNLSVQYDFLPKFRLNGGFSVSKGASEYDAFTSPDHTSFASTEPILRGKYTNSKTNNFSYSANALLSYGNVIGKHSVTINLRGQLSNNHSNSATFIAQGFPAEINPILKFAYGYENFGVPNSRNSIFRSLNGTASTNYSYASRYLFDASYRVDGSSSFGKNNPWSPYWSTGIGWNLHNESFLKNVESISQLKFFSNIGVTGNQSMGAPPSNTVYQYLRRYNQAGLGINVLQLGNPDLLPQKTTQISSGLDLGLFNNRLTVNVNVYSKVTKNQHVPIDLPTSTGVSSFQYTVGTLTTKGAEFRLNYAIIRNTAKRIVWRVNVTGSRNDARYGGFGDALKQLNAKEIKNKTLNRYEDGASPNDLFTVISLGIDPATGREMFLRENGDHTLEYDQAHQPKVGSNRPFLEGVFSNQFNYKNLSLSLMMRYRIKAMVYNSALLQKVENIEYSDIINNQDRRALYDRWKKPGDVSQFKNIFLGDGTVVTTQLSSRFLQVENSLSFESINVNYTFANAKWLKSFGVTNLNLSAYANDIYRFSTVKRERGTEYPYARSISFSLRASF
ncbi:SusC/RagA family TonB-linked outer membrane protein [Pedobacter nyackensis]|nr:SusC/RagA family TonB-linked outer membrane protein [Pedobacter nyackensis]